LGALDWLRGVNGAENQQLEPFLRKLSICNFGANLPPSLILRVRIVTYLSYPRTPIKIHHNAPPGEKHLASGPLLREERVAFCHLHAKLSISRVLISHHKP